MKTPCEDDQAVLPAPVVLKFGGSSLGSPERIAHVARRVAARSRQGYPVVVVVSAMQGETDRLTRLSEEVMAHALGDSSSPQTPALVVQQAREGDAVLATGEQVTAGLLALALRQQGVVAQSFGGAQMRLYTDGNFSRARLKQLDKTHVVAALSAGQVVVATGFQGIDGRGHVTTLGRGGSDTSAVALAAVLKARCCEIFTDVDGVYTADPRVCPDAQKIASITFDEMLEMASLGSRVLQIRSVELAMNHRVPVRVRSTFSEDEGTLVGFESAIERLHVVGISHAEHEAKVSLRGVQLNRGALTKIFGRLSEAGINVDVIVQTQPVDGRVDLAFTTTDRDATRARVLLTQEQPSLGFEQLEVADDVGKVSVVGVGMMSHPGVAAQMFAALEEAGVPIALISTSEIKITCIVAREHLRRAVTALHRSFKLEQPRDR